MPQLQRTPNEIVVSILTIITDGGNEITEEIMKDIMVELYSLSVKEQIQVTGLLAGAAVMFLNLIPQTLNQFVDTKFVPEELLDPKQILQQAALNIMNLEMK